MTAKQRYTINGISYDSLEEMPPEVRERWNSMADVMTAMNKLTRKGIQSGKVTNVRFEYQTTRDTARPASTRQPDAKMPESLGTPSWPDTTAPSDKPAGRMAALILFPTLGLAFFGAFSGVHVTLRYGFGWWLAYGLLMLSLLFLAWRLRYVLGRGFFPRNEPTATQLAGKALAGTLGIGVLAAMAVFGGAPAVGHYLTAHQGEMTVTVTGKDARRRTYRCSMRLYIGEFRVFGRQALCVDDRAYDQIEVGSRIRLQGEVSPFGITVTRYYWYPAK